MGEHLTRRVIECLGMGGSKVLSEGGKLLFLGLGTLHHHTLKRNFNQLSLATHTYLKVEPKLHSSQQQ